MTETRSPPYLPHISPISPHISPRDQVTDTICQQLAKMDALKLAISELANHVTDAQAGLVSGSSSLLVLC